MEALAELKKTGEDEFWKEIGNPKNLREYILLTQKQAKGINLPKGWIPFTTYWLIDQNEFIGIVQIRHKLTPHLRKIGGLIGYTIRPSKRKQGYGKKILALALPKAKKLGLTKILVTCDENNLASKKIIEANDGIYETTNPQGRGKPKKLLYWIKLK